MQQKYNYNFSTTDFNEHCSCNYDTILAISSCQTHKRIQKDLKFPNLMLSPKDCVMLKAGWVKKKTTSIFLGFQDRYLVLYSNKKLIYYKPRTKDPLFKQRGVDTQYSVEQIQQGLQKCGEFDLNIVVVQVQLVEQQKFQMKFTGMNRIFVFMTYSSQEAYNWKGCIEKCAFSIKIKEE